MRAHRRAQARPERSARARRLVGRLALVVALGTGLGACAYGFRAGQVREGLETVAVPYFENRTSEPSLDVEFTETIIEALIADRTVRVVDEATADALLIGSIRRYRVDEAFFGADRQAEEYKVDIEVEVSLVAVRGGEVIVEPKRLRGTGSFYVDEGIEGELAARDEAAQAIVKGIVDLVVEEW